MRGQNEIVQCIVMCLINCLDSMVEYFNKYAYTEIALYGKTYVCILYNHTYTNTYTHTHTYIYVIRIQHNIITII